VQCSAAKPLRKSAKWSRKNLAARAGLVLVVVLVARAASRRRQASSAASAQTWWCGSGHASDMQSSGCWSSCSSTSINVLVFVSRGVSVIGTYLGVTTLSHQMDNLFDQLAGGITGDVAENMEDNGGLSSEIEGGTLETVVQDALGDNGGGGGDGYFGGGGGFGGGGF